MKINWGTGIVIGMVAFMGFIMFMVITMMTDKEYDHDMVTENYYAKDLVYQNEIDAEKKANSLTSKIKIEKSSEGLHIYFPEELQEKNVIGFIQMYRPSNEKLDFQIPLQIENSTMLIEDSKLVGGSWKVTIAWEMDGEQYLFKKAIVY
ncbi:MAG TPA: cytochrome C oxidase Cbb3 [Flavobacteriaceae bacterium]|nr:cytochrome C oxidase Cbb3 [Flavobacteriaceae bacterium]HAT66273.1 cytochrome C oxidase Cbb3 [Flavobacteriaceae bacterium]|tara:strand:+ start:127850 stop:128296 length:447 start_codon:yes stop_codon:yes gene_type:complete